MPSWATAAAATMERWRPFCALGAPENAVELDAVADAGDSHFVTQAALPTICMKEWFPMTTSREEY